MEKKIIFQKGPSICATFTLQKTLIHRIQLQVADQPELVLVGSPSVEGRNQVLEWFTCYINSSPLPSLHLNLSLLSPFQQKVLLALKQTSFGAPLSYKELASLSGSPKASRAVGTVCKKNPFPLVVPCHRVIRSDLKIGQFNGGVEIKKRLLSFEGALGHCL